MLRLSTTDAFAEWFAALDEEVAEDVDLTNPMARDVRLARLRAEGLRVVVVTEGLLAYLDEGTARSLERAVAVE